MSESIRRPVIENDPSKPELELDRSLIFPDEVRQPFNPIRFRQSPFETMDVSHALGIPPSEKTIRMTVTESDSYGKGIWDYLKGKYGPVSGGIGPSSGPNTTEEERTTIVYSLDAAEPMTRWLPSTNEISAVIGLAKGVAPDKERPTVLDMSCLTGLVPYALAQTEQVDVIGTEVDRIRLHANDPYFKHPHLNLSNISGWQAALLYAPEYSKEITSELADRFDIFSPLMQGVYDVIHSMKYDQNKLYSDEQEEYIQKFHSFMEDTRTLTAQRIKESPIDVAMTSNLPYEFIALTPIQEILQPKAIVSVDYNNGNYFGFPEDVFTEDLTGKYYEGGENYHQIAEWKGYTRENWTGRAVYGWNNPADYEKARINVFLRNDVTLNEVTDLDTPPMPWEKELNNYHTPPTIAFSK